MRMASIRSEWPFAAMLVMGLLLGIAIAEGFNVWSDADEEAPVMLLDTFKGALVLAAAMVIFVRVTRLRLFDQCNSTATDGASEGLK
jgi:hypothetical protein